jgi:hypothetical protein
MTVSTESLLEGCTVAWDSTAMSGTSKRVGETCQLSGLLSSYSFQVSWTNTSSVIGAFGLEECNDGTSWAAVSITSPSVSSNSSTGIITRTTSAKFARVTYTNTSGTGTLGAIVAHGKRGKLTGDQVAQLDAATADVLTALADAATVAADLATESAFTPATAGDWPVQPTTVHDALNKLAARVKALEP